MSGSEYQNILLTAQNHCSDNMETKFDFCNFCVRDFYAFLFLREFWIDAVLLITLLVPLVVGDMIDHVEIDLTPL